jgi:lysophospholipase L1-like esterase
MTDGDSRRGTTRANLILAAATGLVTLVVLLAAAEVFIRLTRPSSTLETQRQSALEYESTLFARHAFPRVEQTKVARWGNTYRISSRGYRGDDFAVPKPAGLTRVVVLGGSAGFDIRASDGEDWPALLEGMLSGTGDARVEVINAAVPGHASWDSLGRLLSEIWMFEPDWVVVYHCWNDLKYFETLRPETSLLRTYRPKRTVGRGSNLVDNPFIYERGAVDRLFSRSELYSRLRERYFRWRLGRISLEGPRLEAASDTGVIDDFAWARRQLKLNLRSLAHASRAVGAEPVFVTQARLVTSDNTAEERALIDYGLVQMSHERLVQAFAACDAATREVAQEEDVLLVETAELTGRPELFADHVHTARDGSERLAAMVAERFRGALDSIVAAQVETAP